MVTCQITFLNMTKSLCKYDKMSVDEIDTILLSWTRSLTRSRWNPILQQNIYVQTDRDKQE